MNRYLLIGLILLLIIGGVVTYLLLPHKQPATQTPNPSLPFGEPATSAGFANVTGSQGDQITVRDFTKDPSTEADPANPGSYYIAGKSAYCPIGETCTTDGGTFNIVYYSGEESFVIALLAEPLGQARLDAESYLMNALGISKEEMCKLNYYVSTDSYTSEIYSGQNLLFSFCPGAVKLP